MPDAPVPGVSISKGNFVFDEIREALAARAAAAPPPLGVLSHFMGEFGGTGFNTIFRPNSGPPTTTTFPKPVAPPPPQPPSENVLELNLTTETLTFSKALGNVPNRGLEAQNDIFLNGVPYVQTINAQALGPTATIAGPPTIPPVSITPFPIGNPSHPIRFNAQTAADTDTPRIPQDLTKFIAEGTITQAILDDPNTILRVAIAHQTIVETIVFTVATSPRSPVFGGGTANIAFLEGNQAITTPNADAVTMTATFWIETVEHKIQIPIFRLGQPPLRIP